MGAQKLLLDLICIVFIDIKDNQLGGVEGSQPAAQFAADAPTAAGDQHHLALNMSADFPQIHLHRFPAQQILNFHVADLLNADLALAN